MKIPAPLFRDPIWDGAADPMVIRKEEDGKYYMFYTQRRAMQQVEGVSYCYGSAIGVAESPDGLHWHYRGALDLEFEFGHNTFWAPEIVYDPEQALYHMFVTYIQGIRCRWEGDTSMEHYTSRDLFRWDRVGPVDLGSRKAIDACVARTPEGLWRMWYRDERHDVVTCYADSPDLYRWEPRGIAAGDCAQEGPNVFTYGGKHWLVSDVWDGFAVYRSEDMEHFTRQPENILREGSSRPLDGVKGGHGDVFFLEGEPFVVYFTHPYTGEDHPRTVIQLAPLAVEDGKLVCRREGEVFP